MSACAFGLVLSAVVHKHNARARRLADQVRTPHQRTHVVWHILIPPRECPRKGINDDQLDRMPEAFDGSSHRRYQSVSVGVAVAKVQSRRNCGKGDAALWTVPLTPCGHPVPEADPALENTVDDAPLLHPSAAPLLSSCHMQRQIRHPEGFARIRLTIDDAGAILDQQPLNEVPRV